MNLLKFHPEKYRAILYQAIETFKARLADRPKQLKAFLSYATPEYIEELGQMVVDMSWDVWRGEGRDPDAEMPLEPREAPAPTAQRAEAAEDNMPPELWSPSKRTAANLKAMQVLAAFNPGTARTEEFDAMRLYSGWGGLSIDAVADRFPPGLPVPESKALVHEYYTPSLVTQEVARVIRPLMAGLPAEGEDGKVIALEPSAGIGRFVRALVGDGFSHNLDWRVVEMSPLSARMLQALRPDIVVHNTSFEEWFSKHGAEDDGRVGLVVMNPPYGPRGASIAFDTARGYNKIKEAYRYFMKRGLNMLAPGGLGVCLVPGGFMTGTGAEITKFREKILLEHHISAAYRLPSGLFPGALLVTDLIFFRCRPGELVTIDVKDNFIRNGEYFKMFPQNILGKEVGRDGGDDDQTKTPRFGYQVQGTFERLPRLEERQICTDCDLKAPKVRLPTIRRKGAKAEISIGATAVAADPALLRAARLGQRVDEYLVLLASEASDKPSLVWEELHDDLVAWSSAHGNPRMNKALMALVNDPEASNVYKRFIAAFEPSGSLIDGLRKRPTFEPRYQGSVENIAEIADWYYRQYREMKLSKLLEVMTHEAKSRDLALPEAPEVIIESQLPGLLATGTWAIGGKAFDELIPERDYYSGDLWPRYDACMDLLNNNRPDVAFRPINERATGDHKLGLVRGCVPMMQIQAQAKKLRDLINPVTAQDLISQDKANETTGDVKTYTLATPNQGWMPDHIVQAFCRHYFGKGRAEDDLLFERGEGKMWLVKDTSLADAYSFSGPYASVGVYNFTMYLNNQYSKMKFEVSDDGPSKSDQAKEYMDDIASAFKKWILRVDPEKAIELTEYYNRTFRGYVPPIYSSEPIKLGRWLGAIEPSPWQIAGARRIIANRGGLLAFDVGVGKTFTSLLVLAAARQERWAKRPVLLVPNSIVWKWYKDITQKCLPDYRVGVIGASRKIGTKGAQRGKLIGETDTAEQRAMKWAKFQAGEYDVMLVTHSMIGRTEIDRAMIEEYASESIALVQNAMEDKAAAEAKAKMAVEEYDKLLDKLYDEHKFDVRSVTLANGSPTVRLINRPSPDGWDAETGMKAIYDKFRIEIQEEIEAKQTFSRSAKGGILKPLPPGMANFTLSGSFYSGNYGRLTAGKIKTISNALSKLIKQWITIYRALDSQHQAEWAAGTLHHGAILGLIKGGEEEKVGPVGEKKKTERQVALRREEIAAFVANMLAPPAKEKPDDIKWDDLGIDLIIVDEAQNFKNLHMPKSRIEGVPKFMGGAGEGSKRAWHLDYRTWSIRRRTGGSGVVLLSATPAKNSPLEFYNMLQYIDRAAFEKLGINGPEAFIDRYMIISPIEVVNATLQQEKKAAVVGFQNAIELRSILYKYSEFKAAREIPDLKKKLPKVIEADYQQVPLTDYQEQKYVNYLKQAEDAMLDPKLPPPVGILAKMLLLSVHPHLDETPPLSLYKSWSELRWTLLNGLLSYAVDLLDADACETAFGLDAPLVRPTIKTPVRPEFARNQVHLIVVKNERVADLVRLALDINIPLADGRRFPLNLMKDAVYLLNRGELYSDELSRDLDAQMTDDSAKEIDKIYRIIREHRVNVGSSFKIVVAIEKNVKDFLKKKMTAAGRADDAGDVVPEDGGESTSDGAVPATGEATDNRRKRADRFKPFPPGVILHDLDDIDGAWDDRLATIACDRGLIDPRSPKFERLAENIKLNVNCGHIVFVENIAAHRWIQRSLSLYHGIPADRIAILNAALVKDASKRQEIAQKFNGTLDDEFIPAPGVSAVFSIPPEYDVLIANKIAYEGIDLQTRTCAIHHIDVPWEPASLQQRNGRGVRQGQTMASITLYHYLSLRSADALKLQSIEGKRAWMDALLAGEADIIENDGASSDAVGQIIAELSRDPEKSKAAQEAGKLRKLMAQRAQRISTAVRTFNTAASDFRQARGHKNASRSADLREAAELGLKKVMDTPSDIWPWGQHTAIIRDRYAFVSQSASTLVYEGMRARAYMPGHTEQTWIEVGRTQNTGDGILWGIRTGKFPWYEPLHDHIFDSIHVTPESIVQVIPDNLSETRDAGWDDIEAALGGTPGSTTFGAWISKLNFAYSPDDWVERIWAKHAERILRMCRNYAMSFPKAKIPIILDTIDTEGKPTKELTVWTRNIEGRQKYTTFKPTVAGFHAFLAAGYHANQTKSMSVKELSDLSLGWFGWPWPLGYIADETRRLNDLARAAEAKEAKQEAGL